MATPLDLQEQEQIDQLKAFWNQYGNLITWTLTLALAGFAAWNGWNWWQREQSVKAGALYDELDRVAQAGDTERVARAFADLKERFPRTLQAQQGALLAARVQAEKGQSDAALAVLAWAAEDASEDEYRTIAHLRAAGLLIDKKQYDEALKQLDSAQQGKAREFDALIADRRGDVLAAQGKAADAVAAYKKAWDAMDSKLEYRRLVDAKLTALGAAPEAGASAAGTSGGAAK
ncbi:MAG: tetratricopeptide repeat protein [Aquincola sp.]|nr:tetratricopeptide repeat protein [Aquincola sp.]MDH5329758.1 tetratricopeptide repeat protein [Aquincola sp.]